MGKSHVFGCTGPLSTTACKINCPAFSDIHTCVTDHGPFAKCLWDVACNVTLSLFTRFQKHVMQLQPEYRATEIYTQTYPHVHADPTVICSRTYSGLG